MYSELQRTTQLDKKDLKTVRRCFRDHDQCTFHRVGLTFRNEDATEDIFSSREIIQIN